LNLAWISAIEIAGDLSETRVRQVVDRRAEIRAIENVEEVRFETDLGVTKLRIP
jgi:hypothetical protein